MSREDIIAAAKSAISNGQDQVLSDAINAACDSAVAEAGSVDVSALQQQISDLQAQVAGMFTADQVHQAVLDEDSKLAAKLKPILDALAAANAPADPQPAE